MFYSILMILFIILINMDLFPNSTFGNPGFYSLRYDVLALILLTGTVGVILFLLPVHALGKFLNLTIATLLISFINLTYMFVSFIAFNRHLINFFKIPHIFFY